MTNYMYMELQMKHIKKTSFIFQLDKQIKELGAQPLRAKRVK